MNLSAADLPRLLSFVKKVDDSFNPPISSRANIPDFCEKMMSNAVVCGVCSGKSLSAVGAIYCNDLDNRIAYIPFLAVDGRRTGQGLGSLIVSALLNSAREANMKTVLVRTETENSTALHLYEKFGFVDDLLVLDNVGEGQAIRKQQLKLRL